MESLLKRVFVVFFFTFIGFSSVSGQQLNKRWMLDLNQELEAFLACDRNPVEGVSPCNKFLGNALNTVYNVNDFYSSSLGRHMLVSEMAAYLEGNPQWTFLGRGFEQQALSNAQEMANSGRAVVAIYLNAEGIGHMSLILPGELRRSGTWGFEVPNSASFFTAEPEKSYIGRGLSYAYERPILKGVQLYVRNY